MSSYRLSSLIRIRQHYKNLADNHLIKTMSELNEAEMALKHLQEKLQKIKDTRVDYEYSFFINSKSHAKNMREVNNHLYFAKKNINQEALIINNIEHQINSVIEARHKYTLAQEDALKTNKELKVINKHFELWQKRKNRQMALNDEYQSDELSTNQFLAKQHRSR